MTRRPRPIIGAAAAIVALAFAGCSDEGEPEAEETTASTEPAVTAPPTTSPEEQAEAEIIATFLSTIEALDDFYANASDYARIEDPFLRAAEILEIVQSELRMSQQASLDFENSMGLFTERGIEQIKSTSVARFDVDQVTLAADGAGSAAATACLDQTQLEFRTFDGRQPLDFEPSRYQTWAMDWVRGATGEADSGWYLTHVEIAVNDPC